MMGISFDPPKEHVLWLIEVWISPTRLRSLLALPRRLKILVKTTVKHEAFASVYYAADWYRSFTHRVARIATS